MATATHFLQGLYRHVLKGSILTTFQMLRLSFHDPALRSGLATILLAGGLSGIGFAYLLGGYYWTLALIYPLVIIYGMVLTRRWNEWKISKGRSVVHTQLDNSDAIKVILRDAIIQDVTRDNERINVTLTHRDSRVSGLDADAQETGANAESDAFPNPFVLPLEVHHHEKDAVYTQLQFIQTLSEHGEVAFYLSGKADKTGGGRTREQVHFQFPSWTSSFA